MSKASKEDADAADFREGLAKLSSFLKVALQELESARRMADTEKAKQVVDRVTTLLREAFDKNRKSTEN